MILAPQLSRVCDYSLFYNYALSFLLSILAFLLLQSSIHELCIAMYSIAIAFSHQSSL